MTDQAEGSKNRLEEMEKEVKGENERVKEKLKGLEQILGMNEIKNGTISFASGSINKGMKHLLRAFFSVFDGNKGKIMKLRSIIIKKFIKEASTDLISQNKFRGELNPTFQKIFENHKDGLKILLEQAIKIQERMNVKNDPTLTKGSNIVDGSLDKNLKSLSSSESSNYSNITLNKSDDENIKLIR